MKKTLSILISAVIILFTLCSCSEEKISLTVNGADFSGEIYSYCLSVAENDSRFAETKDKKAAALELCGKYAAENELIKKYNVSLSAEEKVAVAETTKAQWLYFKDFYEKYSVSKQTFNSIIEHQKLVEDVISAIYSEKGETPLSKEEIREFYDKNYISAQIISTDFTDENGNPSDEKTIKQITGNFTDMRNAVRNGSSMESAAQQFPEFAEYEGEVSIISSFDTSYPPTLFENVSKLKKGDIQVYKYNRIIYLVHRLDSSADNLYFSLYSKDCIIEMKKNDFEKTVNTLAQSYKIVYNN